MPAIINKFLLIIFVFDVNFHHLLRYPIILKLILTITDVINKLEIKSKHLIYEEYLSKIYFDIIFYTFYFI